MPDADFYIREGDHGETIASTLIDAAGTPVDLTGGTLTFAMAPITGGTPVVNASAVIEAGTLGGVHYTWAASDTATPGLYMAEWEFTYPTGEVQTFPNTGYVFVRVTSTVTP